MKRQHDNYAESDQLSKRLCTHECRSYSVVSEPDPTFFDNLPEPAQINIVSRLEKCELYSLVKLCPFLIKYIPQAFSIIESCKIFEKLIEDGCEESFPFAFAFVKKGIDSNNKYYIAYYLLLLSSLLKKGYSESFALSNEVVKNHLMYCKEMSIAFWVNYFLKHLIRYGHKESYGVAEEIVNEYINNHREIYPENVVSCFEILQLLVQHGCACLLYTSPSPRDLSTSRMPSSA